MIARKVKERHVEALDERIEFLPLAFQFFHVPVPPASLDHVPDRDHELRAQLVELGHRFGKDPRPRSARSETMAN